MSKTKKDSFTPKQLSKWLELPADTRLEKQPLLFDDSSHDIYFIHPSDATDVTSVLKVLRPSSIRHSAFWRLMNDCFHTNLVSQIACFYVLYPMIEESSPLKIPSLQHQIIEPMIAFDSTSSTNQPLYLTQTQFLKGETAHLEPGEIEPDKINALATHMACLHLKTSSEFGSVDHPISNRHANWSTHLKKVMTENLPLTPQISPEMAKRILSMIQPHFNPESFCLIMPDLRWDQFLQREETLYALTDLDAIVFGPRELDWVLLEYLISPAQAEIFLQEYKQFLSVPDLTEVREVYRVLLYMMNVLGEMDFEAWMKQPKLFNIFNY